MAHLVVPGSKLSVLGSVRRAAALRRAEEDGESDGAADAREPVHAPSDEAEGREPESLTAVWLDEQGQAIGSVLALKLPASELVEAFGPDGRIGAEPVAGDLLITHEPPAAARGLLLRHANETLMLDRSELARADALPGPPRVRSFPDAHRAFLYPVFSDGFLDDEEFFELVGVLADWIGRQPPFDGPELAGRFGMKAFFWRAPGPGVSHFGAPLTGEKRCDGSVGTPVLLGSREVAAELLGHLMPDGQGIILMKSSQRGGAGGHAPSRFPAWASVTACLGEDWRRIALHEMGHSLGLEDEYVLPALPEYRPWRDQPFDKGVNAASRSDPADLPWRDMLNLGGDVSQPTITLAEQGPTWIDPMPGGRPLVGSVAGAHYHEKYFRPSGDCLMRTLAAHRFCPVCQAHIVARLR